MFNQDFYPTPENVIEKMLQGFSVEGKTILEPSAGKGNIVDHLLLNGAASVIACEKNEDLKKILQTKCPVIADDFLTVESHHISHVDFIIMNPPFSADEKHILHAYEIAPPGCQIIALCNLNTLKHTYTNDRKQLKAIIEQCGRFEDFKSCFDQAERKTSVDIACVYLQKPGENYSSEFDGFFMEEDPEERQEESIMPYNFVRDLVNRYVAAVKIYDEQLNAAVKMNNLTAGFYSSKLAVSITEEGKPKARNEFKKDLQKSGWSFIFSKMNMDKYATRGLKEDINKFVEQQQNIPFTMRNIYRMLEIVIGTTGQRMDKAILEVFELLTQHHAENRFNVEGWKTNSHYLVNKKFIFPWGVEISYRGKMDMRWSQGEKLADLEKALCFITGENYDTLQGLRNEIDGKEFGQWYESHFFRFKGFKKGTLHLQFKTDDLWAKFNQHVARIKGYPLYEPKTQTAYQDRQTGRAQQEKGTTRKAQEKFEAEVLFRAKVA